MSTDAFSEREKGFEAKYKLDQETQFKIEARRNRLFGQWIAAKLGKSGADADAYAKEVVAADFQAPGHDDVIEKVMKDLAAAGLRLEIEAVRAEYEQLLGTARTQVMAEVAKR